MIFFKIIVDFEHSVHGIKNLVSSIFLGVAQNKFLS